MYIFRSECSANIKLQISLKERRAGGVCQLIGAGRSGGWWWCNLHSAAGGCWADLRLTKVLGRRPLPTPAAPPPPPPAADAATSFLLSGPLVVTSTRHCHHQQQPSIPPQEDPVFTILHSTIWTGARIVRTITDSEPVAVLV